MKILMTTTNSSLMDGINRHILTVSRALKKEGIDVAVCITQPGGELAGALEAAGIKVYSTNATNGHALHILWRFAKIMREFSPDIIHIHVLPFMARVVLATMFQHLRYVGTIHGISDPVKKLTVRMKIENLFVKIFQIKFSALCYVSQGVKDACRTSGCPIHKVIYNPVEIAENARGELRRELGLRDDIPLVGTACRMAEVKDPIAFVCVMSKVLNMITNAHAVVIGSGDVNLEALARRVAEESGDASRFHFLGFRKNASTLIRDLDCFVMTSKREGMPTALLEAMSAGVPVAFMEGDGGLRDLVAKNAANGPFAVTARIGDITGLSDGIVRILKGGVDIENMRKREREICHESFSMEKIAKQMVNMYNKALSCA